MQCVRDMSILHYLRACVSGDARGGSRLSPPNLASAVTEATPPAPFVTPLIKAPPTADPKANHHHHLLTSLLAEIRS